MKITARRFSLECTSALLNGGNDVNSVVSRVMLFSTESKTTCLLRKTLEISESHGLKLFASRGCPYYSTLVAL